MKTCFTLRLSPTKMAIADLCDFYGEGKIITRINVPKEFRGLGHGSDLLKEICKEADQTKTTLWLEILPSDGLDYMILAGWYLRHGFKGFTIFRRIPK